jgi:hypothetical protein
MIGFPPFLQLPVSGASANPLFFLGYLAKTLGGDIINISLQLQHLDNSVAQY